MLAEDTTLTLSLTLNQRYALASFLPAAIPKSASLLESISDFDEIEESLVLTKAEANKWHFSWEDEGHVIDYEFPKDDAGKPTPYIDSQTATNIIMPRKYWVRIRAGALNLHARNAFPSARVGRTAFKLLHEMLDQASTNGQVKQPLKKKKGEKPVKN